MFQHTQREKSYVFFNICIDICVFVNIMSLGRCCKKMESNSLAQERNKMVVKSNDLIQKAQFDLTTQQQKAVAYLISKVKPDDEEFKEYEFPVGEFCKICGIDSKSGKNYAAVKETLKKISDKSIWVELPNGNKTLLRWIEKPTIDEQSGKLIIRLDEDMKPYLLQLQGNFTKYELFWTLQFKKKYSVRLYELVKSIHYDVDEEYIKIYDLDELRLRMGAEGYKTFQHFRERALEPAIEEINKLSDKYIAYETITYGRTVGRIRLIINSKSKTEAKRLQVMQEIKYGTDFTKNTYGIIENAEELERIFDYDKAIKETLGG